MKINQIPMYGHGCIRLGAYLLNNGIKKASNGGKLFIDVHNSRELLSTTLLK